ncbi:MAG: hypothetical protein NXI18_02820 [Alphaproteobacteria bacterium]|nr:hypothetical protein [Alphaproteobacteria bacterium]
MQLRELLATVAASKVGDWQIIFRPTLRHRFTGVTAAAGGRDQVLVDEHAVTFSYRPDIAITMAFGLIDQAAYDLPTDHPFARENARTLFLDIFHEGRLAHRETVVNVDRQRCLLPMPTSWEVPVLVPTAQFSLIRLVHALAGPPTDYDSYFKESGMVRSDTVPWP